MIPELPDLDWSDNRVCLLVSGSLLVDLGILLLRARCYTDAAYWARNGLAGVAMLLLGGACLVLAFL